MICWFRIIRLYPGEVWCAVCLLAEGPTTLHVRFKVSWAVVYAVPIVIVVAGIINVIDVVLSYAGDGR